MRFYLSSNTSFIATPAVVFCNRHSARYGVPLPPPFKEADSRGRTVAEG